MTVLREHSDFNSSVNEINNKLTKPYNDEMETERLLEVKVKSMQKRIDSMNKMLEEINTEYQKCRNLFDTYWGSL